VTDLDAQANPYLTGAWAPVQEESTCVDLQVTGRLPTALRGRYLRNGPNPAFAPLGRYHLFDGDGMVHGIELDEGVARYRNRWVRSRGLDAERRAGRALFGGLSSYQLPPPELLAEAGMMKNTANTHVVHHAGRTLALMEAAPPTELTEALDTVGPYDFDGRLGGPMTAHPKVDPVTGELVFFGYSPLAPYLRYHVADADGVLTTSVDIDLPRAVMMHDFGVSSRRAVFFDLPAVFDLDALLSGGEGIRWEPDAGARIGVLDRSDPHGGVRWVEVEPFFMFHVLNAWDDGDAVVVEGCRSRRLNTSFGAPLEEPIRPHLHRWRIDVQAGRVTEEQLDDRASDFPRLDERRAGLQARFGYVANPRRWTEQDATFAGVVKHDLVDGTSSVHSYGEGAVSGEPVFVADPDRDAEDGGWLLNLVQDDEAGSGLVVLDAEDLHEVARVHIPVRVPSGFHGSWVAAG